MLGPLGVTETGGDPGAMGAVKLGLIDAGDATEEGGGGGGVEGGACATLGPDAAIKIGVRAPQANRARGNIRAQRGTGVTASTIVISARKRWSASSARSTGTRTV